MAELIASGTPLSIYLGAFRVDRFEGRFSSARDVANALASSDEIYFQ